MLKAGNDLPPDWQPDFSAWGILGNAKKRRLAPAKADFARFDKKWLAHVISELSTNEELAGILVNKMAADPKVERYVQALIEFEMSRGSAEPS